MGINHLRASMEIVSQRDQGVVQPPWVFADAFLRSTVDGLSAVADRFQRGV